MHIPTVGHVRQTPPPPPTPPHSNNKKRTHNKCCHKIECRRPRMQCAVAGWQNTRPLKRRRLESGEYVVSIKTLKLKAHRRSCSPHARSGWCGGGGVEGADHQKGSTNYTAHTECVCTLHPKPKVRVCVCLIWMYVSRTAAAADNDDDDDDDEHHLSRGPGGLRTHRQRGMRSPDTRK